MTNSPPDPLSAARANGGQATAAGVALAIGQTRTILCKSGQTLELTRTARSYADDLCDAYNAKRTRLDIIWIVDARGDLQLVDDPQWSKRRATETKRQQEHERSEWKQRSGHNLPPVAPHWQDDGEEPPL